MVDIFLIKLEPDYKSYKIAPPFGILYLASALEKEGFRVKLYHEKGTPKNIRFIVEDILNSHPLFVGFSTLTGPSLTPTLDASRVLKRKLNIPVVWGGLHPTMLPEQTLNNDCIDLVVLGEGEETIVELAKVSAEKGLEPDALKNIKAIAYRENGEIQTNPLRPFITNLDDYFPAWHHLNLEDYFYKGKYFYSEFGSKLPGDKIAAIITSRGCPWRCGYCYNQFVNKRSFRAHSAQRVISDIEWLKKSFNISALAIEDDNFFTNKKRALEIIRNIGIPWESSIRANYVSQWGEDFIRELKENNCVELRIGAESGSQRILDIMHKDIIVEDIYKAVELCKKHNIRILFNFMIGIPGESWPEMLKTFQVMDELEKKGNDIVVSGPSVYYPWPGTPLLDLAVEKGFNLPKRTEEWAVNWGPKQPTAPYVDKKVKFIGFYRISVFRKDLDSLKFPLFARLLRFVAKKRWEKRFFRFPIDYYIPRFFLNLIKALGLKKIAQAIYD